MRRIAPPCRSMRLAWPERPHKGTKDGRVCFFFQAEDGIRDLIVTGVQTCALPILSSVPAALELMNELARWLLELTGMPAIALSPKAGAHGELTGMMAIKAALAARGERSEERRVGKECRSRWSPYH